MKTLQKRKNIYKLLFYVFLSYFVSTWGVNHTVNPLSYARQLSAQVIPVQTFHDEEFLKIVLDDSEKYPYLWINVTESNRFSQILSIQSEDGSATSIELSKGMNCLDIRSLSTNIQISQKELAATGTTLNDISISNEKYVNIRKTLSIFASFLFFSACWELVQWVKKRYTR